MYRPSLLLAGTILALLSACATNKGPLSPDFGNSVNHNMAVHIVNPRVVTPGARAPDLDGDRALTGIVRYQQDEVEELETPATTLRGTSVGGQ